jgi:hypothetical protein
MRVDPRGWNRRGSDSLGDAAGLPKAGLGGCRSLPVMVGFALKIRKRPCLFLAGLVLLGCCRFFAVMLIYCGLVYFESVHFICVRWHTFFAFNGSSVLYKWRFRQGCHDVVPEMRAGPSESACRSGFQTTTSCVGKEPSW